MNQKNSKENIDEDNPPKLLLFLSVDLIGSTEEKVVAINEGKVLGWLKDLKFFYGIFNNQGFSQLNLSLWKYLGDEILFYKELKNSQEIYQTIAIGKNLLS